MVRLRVATLGKGTPFPASRALIRTIRRALNVAYPRFGLVCSTVFLVTLAVVSRNAHARHIAGWVEQAKLLPSGIELKAKLDTGAENSSINASEIRFFTREGREHIRFKVTNKVGETVELTLPVVRHAIIKRHFNESQKRPVILLTICLGEVRKEVEVSLIDRTGFNYPLLIGRSYLGGDFLIDPVATHRLETHCGTAGHR